MSSLLNLHAGKYPKWSEQEFRLLYRRGLLLVLFSATLKASALESTAVIPDKDAAPFPTGKHSGKHPSTRNSAYTFASNMADEPRVKLPPHEIRRCFCDNTEEQQRVLDALGFAMLEDME